MDLTKRSDEGLSAYLWRLGSAKDAGLISQSWEELADIMNKNLFEDETDYIGESAYRKRYSYAKDMYDQVFSKIDMNEERGATYREIEKARKKLQTEKLEYNKWLREEARDEMIVDQISEAIAKLEPLNIPEYISPKSGDKSYLLAFGDAHYGVEFRINDLFGNAINSYAPEIFEARMRELLSKVVDIIDKEGITELNVWDLGDGVDGILRLTSQLMKLRWGIVDGTIRYADYLANWLNVLSGFVRVKFQMVKDSNHTQLRICGAPKNAFPEENMNKIMLTLIKLRLKDNPNISFVENPTGNCYGILSNWCVFGCHGEAKNISRAIDDFSRTYDVHIDYYICGHKHHGASEDVAVDRESIVIRSLIGVDPYAMSLNRTSNPGAALLCFDRINGLECEYKIKL